MSCLVRTAASFRCANHADGYPAVLLVHVVMAKQFVRVYAPASLCLWPPDDVTADSDDKVLNEREEM